MTSPSPLTWAVPVQLGERRVLRRGRWRWLRALAWLLLLFFLTAAAFGLPLQVVVDLLPPGDGLGALVGPLVGSATALGCYVLAVRLGEGRWPGELSLRPTLPGLAVGALLGQTVDRSRGEAQRPGRSRTPRASGGGACLQGT